MLFHPWGCCACLAQTVYGKIIRTASYLLGPKGYEYPHQLEVLSKQARQGIFRPAFVVLKETFSEATDEAPGRIIVSIRGTMNLDDALTDIACEPGAWAGADEESPWCSSFPVPLSHTGPTVIVCMFFLRHADCQGGFMRLGQFGQARGAGGSTLHFVNRVSVVGGMG